MPAPWIVTTPGRKFWVPGHIFTHLLPMGLELVDDKATVLSCVTHRSTEQLHQSLPKHLRPLPSLTSISISTKRTGKAGDQLTSEVKRGGSGLPSLALRTASSPFRPGGPYSQNCHAWRHPPEHLARLPGTPQMSPRLGVRDLTVLRHWEKGKQIRPNPTSSLHQFLLKRHWDPGPRSLGSPRWNRHGSHPLSKLVRTGGSRVGVAFATYDSGAGGAENELFLREGKSVQPVCVQGWPVPPESYLEKGCPAPGLVRDTEQSPQASSPAHANSSGPGPTRQVSLLPQVACRRRRPHLASVGAQEQVHRNERRRSTGDPPTARSAWEPRAPQRPAQARTCPPRCPELSA